MGFYISGDQIYEDGNTTGSLVFSEETIYVDVQRRGTVSITEREHGIEVNIFTLDVNDKPVGTLFVPFTEIWAAERSTRE
tara:strand:+ start:198 stop:437 length:240 start_codon:yes stop_codon:yes gene_type:complete